MNPEASGRLNTFWLNVISTIVTFVLVSLLSLIAAVASPFVEIQQLIDLEPDPIFLIIVGQHLVIIAGCFFLLSLSPPLRRSNWIGLVSCLLGGAAIGGFFPLLVLLEGDPEDIGPSLFMLFQGVFFGGVYVLVRRIMVKKLHGRVEKFGDMRESGL